MRTGRCGSRRRLLPAHRLPCQGNKLNNLVVVYTPASNLRKTADMEVGQVRKGERGAAPAHRAARHPLARAPRRPRSGGVP